MSLGQAYIDVRANTSGFAEGLKLEVLKAIVQAQALADANAIKIRTTTSGGGSGSSGSSNPFAAANEEALRDLRQHTAELAAAESEAYKESIQRAKDAAADIDQSFGEASQGAKDFGIDLGNLKIPAIVAAASLAAIAAAAVGAGGAVAALGIKSADTIRSLTLQLTDAGDSAKQAAAAIQALQGLAALGLDLTSLAADQQQLDNLGLSAKSSTALLKILGDTFAGEGFVGAALQSQVDAAAKTLTTVVSAGAATSTTIGQVSAALGVSQAAIRHELGLTSAQLDALITKGKVSAASIANAGITAASGLPNSSNGLANAASSSPTQALAALKSQLESAVSGAFAGPGIAQGIDKVGDQLSAAITRVAPTIEKDVEAVLTGLSEAIGPVTNFLEGALSTVGSIISQAVDPSSQLHQFLVDVVDDGEDIIKILLPAFEGFAKTVGGVLEAVKPVLDDIAAFAGTGVGQTLLEVAGGVTAVAVAVKLFGGLSLLIDGVTGSLTALAGVAGLGALSESLIGIATGALPEIAAAAVVAYGTYKAVQEIATDKTTQFASALDASGQSVSSFGSVSDTTGQQVDDLGRVITNATAGASTAVQGLAASLYALPTSVPINVDISVTTSTGQANELIGGLSGRQQNAAQLANGGTDSALSAADQAQEALAKITNAFKGFSGSNGGGSGGGSGGSAAASAAKAIADAAATFKTSLGDFTTAIGGAQTVAAVDSAFASLQSAIDAEDKALGKSEPTGLVTYLAKQKAALDKSASEIQLALSERAQFLGDATVAAANPNVAGVSGIISQLNGQLARSTEFAADLKKLQKEGLNETALNQLLAVGPTSAGLQAANDLLQATAGQIAQINGIQSQIGSAGEGLGISLASNFKTAGQESAAGLIDGLTSAIPAIETAAAKVAKAIDTKFKDALGIKSPSTVFAGHGESIVAGLAQGLARAPIPGVPAPTLSRLAGAGGLGNGNVNNFEITVNNADSSDPRGTGNVIGLAIADVLAARQMNQTFARN